MKDIVLTLFVSLGGDVVAPQTIPGFSSTVACEQAAAELAPVYIAQMESHSAQRSAKGVGLKAEVTHTCTAIEK